MVRLTRDTFTRRFRRLASRMPADDVDALLAVLTKQDVAAGEVVITEGAPVDALLLVWDGELNVWTSERQLASVGAGSYLGEASLLDPGPASATVSADQGCTLLRLDRAAFDDLCNGNPGVATALLDELARVLAARVRTAGERLDDLLAERDGGVVFVGASDAVDVHRRLLDGTA